MEIKKINEVLCVGYYAVPDYQRDYEWTTAQNETLAEDILALINGGGHIRHFLGAIVISPFDNDDSYNSSVDLTKFIDDIDGKNVVHIVDGQQRLVSLSLFACALRDIIIERRNINISEEQRVKSLEKLNEKLKSIIQGDEDWDDGCLIPRVILNGNTGNAYNEIVCGKKTKTNHHMKGAKLIGKAYSFYKEFIEKQMLSDDVDEVVLTRLVDALRNSLTLAVIKCGNELNAFQVFDSLNGKGLNLTPGDRIKSILMSCSRNDKEKNQRWNSIVEKVGGDSNLTGFFVALFFYNPDIGKRIKKNMLPEAFKEQYKSKAVKSYEAYIDICEELAEDAEIYGSIRNVDKIPECLKQHVENLSLLCKDQIYVILFAVAKNYRLEEETNKFIEFVKALQSLIVRMHVCERSYNSLDTEFSSWIKEMNGGTTDLDEITKKVIECKKKKISDSTFEVAFSDYAPNNNKISQFFLVEIENYLRVQNLNQRDKLCLNSSISVEHIIPQTLESLVSWFDGVDVPEEVRENPKDLLIERMGNKLLLYKDDNSSAGNNDFSLKRKVYKEGKMNQSQGTPYDTFAIVKNFMDNEEYEYRFNYSEVNKRSKDLAKIAVEIW